MKERSRLPHHKAKVTLAEVARLAEVSEITVSRIMRNKGPVSDATRDRVLAVVKLLGYVPNRIAGSLASATSNIIGVAIPSLSNIVFPEVLRGIHAGLKGTDFQPVVGVTDYNIETEEALVRSLMAWKPAAMILAGVHAAAQGVGGDPASADPADRGHSRIVPPGDRLFVHELDQLALGDDRVIRDQLGEFVLAGKDAR